MIQDLLQQGDEIMVASRPKDVTTELLDNFGIPHQVIGSGPGDNWFRQGAELATRVTSLVKIGRTFEPDVVCTRNPAGAIASRLLRKTTCLFDTDDGKAAGPVYSLAYPFATLTTLPDFLPESKKRKHLGYPSYKSLAFTHPNRFAPDPSIRQDLGVGDSPYFILRLTSFTAAHDHGEAGVSIEAARALVDLLSPHGTVVVSSEGDLPADLAELAYTGSKDRFHDALAFADFVVGDSLSVIFEAAILGTPGAFISTFARRVEALNEIEDKYSLISQYQPKASQTALTAIADAVTDLGATSERGRVGQAKLLSEKVDLTTWYVDLIKSFG